MKRNISLLLLLLFFAPVIFIYMYSIPFEYSYNNLVVTSVFITIVSIVLFVTQETELNLKKQYVKPSNIFLVGYFVVFFQAYVDLLFGFVSEQESFRFISSDLINYSFLLCGLGFVFYCVGYLSFKNIKTSVVNNKVIKIIPLKFFFYISFLFFFVFNAKAMLTSQYSQAMIESHAGSLGSYMEYMFVISYYAVLIVHTKNMKVFSDKSPTSYFLKLGILFHVFLAVYIILIMISGDRGPILNIALSYFFSFILVTKIKIKPITFIIYLTVGALLLTTLGAVRKIDSQQTWMQKVYISLSELTNQKNLPIETSFIPATIELSKSVRTVHLVVQYIENDDSYIYGVTMLRELFYVVPLLSNLTDYFFNPHFRFKNGAFFITWLDKGDHYTAGAGSSLIADQYINYGVLGVSIGMFLIGRLFRYLDCIVFSKDNNNITIFDITVLVIISSVLIYWSRSTLFTPLKDIFIMYAFLILYISLFSRGKINV